ncbi:MAG: ABC transporter substrate-binding protein [Candidatus Kapabacteria bacterium]|nr:ABC transporter substrate-binding protein [Candidatus Kapabacteria bacterium]
MPNRCTVTLAICIITMMLSACKKPGTPEGETRPARGGKNYGGIYRVNESGEVRGLDPVGINDATSSHVAENIYDVLFSFDEQLRLRPELATSFDVSADGRSYTYHLRTDVWFHDDPCFAGGKGRKMTAYDVRYSFTRACDYRANTRTYDYLRGKVLGADAYYASTRKGAPLRGGVAGFVVVDDSTFRIDLEKPFAPFENYVALTSMSIHPREAVEYYGKDFFQHPVGTGPFVFASWAPDQHLVLKRNPRYWMKDEQGNQLPMLDGVRFSFMKDDKMQLLEFQGGNLEESYRIPNEFFADIVDERKELKGPFARFRLLRVPSMGTQYYGMLMTDPVFKDKRIRQAFNYAVDRSRIIRYVLRGQAMGPGTHGLVPAAVPGYPAQKVQGYTFDPDKARALLAAAGYPDGKGFPNVTLQLNAGGGRNAQVAEAIQGMLAEHLNVKINLTQVEFAQHLERIDAGRAGFYRLGWVGDYPDPETFLNLFYGKLVPTGGGISPINSVRYVSPAFDAAFERAIGTTDHAARMELYRQAEQIAINDAPMIVLFYDEDYRLVQPYVRDYRNNSMDRRPYKFIWYDLSNTR